MEKHYFSPVFTGFGFSHLQKLREFCRSSNHQFLHLGIGNAREPGFFQKL